jgi:hypothetical protein
MFRAAIHFNYSLEWLLWARIIPNFSLHKMFSAFAFFSEKNRSTRGEERMKKDGKAFFNLSFSLLHVSPVDSIRDNSVSRVPLLVSELISTAAGIPEASEARFRVSFSLPVCGFSFRQSEIYSLSEFRDNRLYTGYLR